MRAPTKRCALAPIAAIGMAMPALAGGFDAMSDGSDGILIVPPSEQLVIDASQAITGAWDTPSPIPGAGVYDPELWVVVYKYESVLVSASADVTFQPHPSGAPIVWLVQTDVILETQADIRLDALGSTGGEPATPPPGAFLGGRPGSAGFGPGGGTMPDEGSTGGGGGGYGSPGDDGDPLTAGATYGNASLVPLVGGSGGGSAPTASGPGGTGGGAILIAASGSILFGFNSGISANGGNSDSGGNGAGSGGAIRLVANEIASTSQSIDILARGGTSGNDGGDGRIRIEANIQNFSGISFDPLPSFAAPGPLFQDPSTPALRIVNAGGQPVSDDPRAHVYTPDAPTIADSPVVITIEANNIAPGSIVDVLITPAEGESFIVQSSPLAGSFAFSTATASLALPSAVPVEVTLLVDAGARP